MKSKTMYIGFKDRSPFITCRGCYGKLTLVEDWDEDTHLPAAYSGYLITAGGTKIWNVWYDDGTCLEPNYNISHFVPAYKGL